MDELGNSDKNVFVSVKTDGITNIMTIKIIAMIYNSISWYAVKFKILKLHSFKPSNKNIVPELVAR